MIVCCDCGEKMFVGESVPVVTIWGDRSTGVVREIKRRSVFVEIDGTRGLVRFSLDGRWFFEWPTAYRRIDGDYMFRRAGQ